MVQAAVEGTVDFSQAKVFDPRWHRHLRLVLRGLDMKNRRELRRLIFEQTVAVYTSRRIKQEAMSEIAQRVSDLYYDIRETYYPTEKANRVQHEKEMARQDIRGWEARFGRLDAAETKAKMDAFVAGMEQLRQETAKKQSKAASSQLGYVGQQLGLKPHVTHPRKGRK